MSSEELVAEDGPRYASRIFAKVIEAIVEMGKACVVDRLNSRTAGLPVSLSLRPPNWIRPHASMAVPLALQEIEVHSASVHDYDHLLGDAA